MDPQICGRVAQQYIDGGRGAGGIPRSLRVCVSPAGIMVMGYVSSACRHWSMKRFIRVLFKTLCITKVVGGVFPRQHISPHISCLL